MVKFSAERWFANDQTLLSPRRLDLILRQAHDLIRQRPVLAGLEDLSQSLTIVHEYMRSQMPRILYKELQRVETGLKIDPLYNEPADTTVQGRQFTRSFHLHAHATYADPKIKHDKTGQSYDQPMTMYVDVLELFLNDYYPEVGDEIIYLGRSYQTTTVFLPVNALFLHTGMPLYVAQTAELWRHGDIGGPEGAKIPRSLADSGLAEPVNYTVDPPRQTLENRLREWNLPSCATDS